MNYSIFHNPAINARVAIAVDSENSRASIAFLAKGRSRRSDGSYVPRNPERRGLFSLFLTEARRMVNEGLGEPVFASGGKSSSPAMWEVGDIRDPFFGLRDGIRVRAGGLERVYRASGNYRLDVLLSLSDDLEWTALDLAFHLNLVPLENVRAPKEVRWLR